MRFSILFCALLGACMGPSPDEKTREGQLREVTAEPVSTVTTTTTAKSLRDLDVLFVIDNSNSMFEEQESLALQIPRMVRALATGDYDRDGVRDAPPIRSLQIGVVTTDMGTGGNVVFTCDEPGFGDDGILQTDGNTAIRGCRETYPKIHRYWPRWSRLTPEQFAANVSCVANMGTGGCGFEQQLDAALKAVTASTAPITFAFDSVGHADGENAGFVRPGAILAVVVLTDENDCSASDLELFNPNSSVYPQQPNLRCFQYPEALYATERYVAGLKAAKANPNDVLFAVIGGVPTDMTTDFASYDAILADPRMQELVDDPSDPTRLVPSCLVPGRGIAFPPRRLVEVAQGFGRYGTVQSICQEDFTPAINGILGNIAAKLAE